MSYVFKKGLNYYKSSKKDIIKQIDISNDIVDMFSKIIDDEEFNNYKIDEDKLLKGILEKEINRRDINKLHPITSISKSSLFTGAQTEPTVFSEFNNAMVINTILYLLLFLIMQITVVWL